MYSQEESTYIISVFWHTLMREAYDRLENELIRCSYIDGDYKIAWVRSLRERESTDKEDSWWSSYEMIIRVVTIFFKRYECYS